jgi:peroxiredoxin
MLRHLIVVFVALGLTTSYSIAQVQAEIGKKAPEFTLKDSAGKEHSLSDYQGKIVVLEWFNTECPFVQRHYKEKTMVNTAGQFADKDVVWLAINTTATAKPEDMNKWIAQYGLTYPILMDNAGEVARKYGAKTTPHIFIIDKQGKLAYEGGIDNDPAGDSGNRTNYAAKALTELTEGKPVSQPETRPYGCSVKYPK